MIINIFKWREDSDTYLTCVCRLRWSGKRLVEIEEITGAFSQHWLSSTVEVVQFLPDAFRSSDVYRCESGRCRSLSIILKYFFYVLGCNTMPYLIVYVYSITCPLILTISPAAILNLPTNSFCLLDTALALTSDNFL